jgi:hypothetical protein
MAAGVGGTYILIVVYHISYVIIFCARYVSMIPHVQNGTVNMQLLCLFVSHYTENRNVVSNVVTG